MPKLGPSPPLWDVRSVQVFLMFFVVLFKLIHFFVHLGSIYGITTLQCQNHNNGHHSHHTGTQNHFHKQLLAEWEWVQLPNGNRMATQHQMKQNNNKTMEQ
jgi:hypothetical protein